MRKLFEFYCTECAKHFDVKLNTSLNGNYRIHCPMCGHVHFRELKNGEITGVRFPDNHESLLIEDIKPMKGCCRDFPQEKPEIDNFLYTRWRERLDVVEA